MWSVSVILQRIRHGFTRRQHACAGFKHVRVKHSLFRIAYVQCDDKAEREPHKPKHMKKKSAFFPQWVSSAAMETSSVIQTTLRITFRAESSFLITCCCINVMTVTSFLQRGLKQRDRYYSSFDLSGFNLCPDIFTFSALFSPFIIPDILSF